MSGPRPVGRLEGRPLFLVRFRVFLADLQPDYGELRRSVVAVNWPAVDPDPHRV
jgi:hypothetical protein